MPFIVDQSFEARVPRRTDVRVALSNHDLHVWPVSLGSTASAALRGLAVSAVLALPLLVRHARELAPNPA